MNAELLQKAVKKIKDDFEKSITTQSYKYKEYANGQKAKEALIRSQNLIMKIHEVAKQSLSTTLNQQDIGHTIHPPLESSSPELKMSGLLKAKQQDIVAIMDKYPPKLEIIDTGPLEGEDDPVGKTASEKSIVVGVRSQLSSVAKNFDTLMERAFAETLNLRLRLNSLVMGEVYLLPIVEYDTAAMKSNEVKFKSGFVPVQRFIKTFLGISGRGNSGLDGSRYKYDRSCLVLVDFRPSIPRIFYTSEELVEAGVIDTLNDDFKKLSPVSFCSDLVGAYVERHG